MLRNTVFDCLEELVPKIDNFWKMCGYTGDIEIDSKSVNH